MDIVYRPAPVPAGASAVARRIVAIANLIPPGRWATYGDIAEAAGSTARGVASALSSVSPVENFDGSTEDVATAVAQWVVPWHRIRMNDGTLKSRDASMRRSKAQSEREHHEGGNSLYINEGGSLTAGEAARVGQRFNLAAEMRRVGLKRPE